MRVGYPQPVSLMATCSFAIRLRRWKPVSDESLAAVGQEAVLGWGRLPAVVSTPILCQDSPGVFLMHVC